MRRAAVDVWSARALGAVLDRLASHAPGLVVARGSTAVFAYAPEWARIPNDLDVYWLGDSAEVPALVRDALTDGCIRAVTTRHVRPPDGRVRTLHRIDLRVHLDGPARATHRLWLDVGTSRRAVPSVPVRLPLWTCARRSVAICRLPELLVEKLWVYLESARAMRADLRWSDLFDTVALVSAAPELRRHDAAELRAACVTYFRSRQAPPPAAGLPAPPDCWGSAWYRLVGPVARRTPTPAAAADLARHFWVPVLTGDADGLRWDGSRWVR